MAKQAQLVTVSFGDADKSIFAGLTPKQLAKAKWTAMTRLVGNGKSRRGTVLTRITRRVTDALRLFPAVVRNRIVGKVTGDDNPVGTITIDGKPLAATKFKDVSFDPKRGLSVKFSAGKPSGLASHH